MLVSAKDIYKLWTEKGRGWTLHHINESVEKGELSMHDFSLRDMAEHLIPDGSEFIRLMNPRRRSGQTIFEAVDAVDTSAFSHITGQLIFSTINDAMKLDTLIGDQLVTVMPSQFQDAERIPGISNASDEFADEITEGEPYPLVGLSEEYVTIPRAEKHGGILGITREAIIADRTGVLVDRARTIGTGLAIRREKAILNVFIGAVNPYARNGEARITYHDTNMGFDNIITDALANYTAIQAAETAFRRMRDPATGEPLGLSIDTIVVVPALLWLGRQIIHATEIRQDQRPVLAAGAVAINQIGVNPIPFELQILSNEWLRDLLLAADGVSGLDTDGAKVDSFWFIGKPKACFVWKEIWPLTVEEAPQNNEAQFSQDIWMRFKCSYKGVPGVREPRLMIRSDGTA
ncbi:MAG TPA: hypothetical protein VMX97_01300 [Hyphomicrobiaceae bacterium]|nr:hypothetical protein [Hyphomicrobiaceae bacterium]